MYYLDTIASNQLVQVELYTRIMTPLGPLLIMTGPFLALFIGHLH